MPLTLHETCNKVAAFLAVDPSAGGVSSLDWAPCRLTAPAPFFLGKGTVMELLEFAAPAAMFVAEVLLVVTVLARCRIHGGRP